MTSLEKDIFDFLCRKYVQRQDDRQKAMGLQYMEAETHDLAHVLASYFVGRVDASLDIARGDATPTDPSIEAMRSRAADAGITLRQIGNGDDGDAMGRHFAGKWFAIIKKPGQMTEEVGPFNSEKSGLITALEVTSG